MATGRSLASINLAFQLSLANRNVALLDMDLVGGTLHHIARPVVRNPQVSLESLRGRNLELKNRRTLLDYLMSPDEVLRIEDVHSENLYDTDGNASIWDIVPRTKRKGLGKLTLYPRSGTEDMVVPPSFHERLTRAFEFLENNRYDVIICDMQAGKSDTLKHALKGNADQTFRACWLIYVRATPQHLAGAQELISYVASKRDKRSPMWLIPTAVLRYSDAAGSHELTGQLAKYVWTRLDGEFKNLSSTYDLKLAGAGLSFARALLLVRGGGLVEMTTLTITMMISRN